MTYHRVDERVAAGTGLVAGLLAATSGASPTGSTPVDIVLVVASTGLVTWAAATAPWWAVAVVAGLSAAVAGSLWLVVGLLALAAGLWIGVTRRDLPIVRAGLTGVALNVLIRSDLAHVLGLSAVIGIAAATVVFLLGLRRRSRTARRNVWIGVITAGSLAGLAILGLALGAALAVPDLQDANRITRAGIDLLDDGDYTAAAAQFEQAAAAFSGAESALTKPWTLPAAAVPVVAQNRTAVVELTSTAAEATQALSDALGVIDPEQLRVVNGRIDIAALELAQQPFVDVQDAIMDLDETIGAISSPWIVAPLQDRLVDLDTELNEARPRVDNAVNAVRLAPQMLGADGARHYFIAFTTPAEIRGQGGIMDSWVELTATEGRLGITAAGTTTELNQSTTEAREVAAPETWLEVWGSYGFTSGPNGRTGPEPWSNITISPHFPATGEVIAQLYPQSGGTELDGVFAMDPFVLQALLGFTGPISLADADTELDQEDLARFLLTGQYDVDDGAEPADLLAAASQAIVLRMFGATLPSPPIVAETLSPLAAQGRLAGWARDADEQALFDDIDLDGALPDLDGGDGIAAVFNNLGSNKLDVYLDRELDYDAAVDIDTGEVSATATVTLTNAAPSGGLPDPVIGSSQPPGTNRILASLYSAMPVVSAFVTTVNAVANRSSSPSTSTAPPIRGGRWRRVRSSSHPVQPFR